MTSGKGPYDWPCRTSRCRRRIASSKYQRRCKVVFFVSKACTREDSSRLCSACKAATSWMCRLRISSSSVSMRAVASCSLSSWRSRRTLMRASWSWSMLLWEWYCCSSCSMCWRVSTRAGGVEPDSENDSDDRPDRSALVGVPAGDGGGLALRRYPSICLMRVREFILARSNSRCCSISTANCRSSIWTMAWMFCTSAC